MKINKVITLSVGCVLLMQTLTVWAGQQALSIADRTEKTLHEAARSGDVDVVRVLLNAGADANALDKYKETPLHIAVQKGNVAVVQLLIEANADTNAKDRDGGTPLHQAAIGGLESIVQLLLGAGAEVNPTSEGDTDWMPLCCAVHGGHENIVRLLLNAGAISHRRTLLHKVVERGNEGISRLLIRAGADVNALDGYGETPLHIAAKKGDEATVQLLLDFGAKVDSVDKFGSAPLHRAKEGGHRAVMRILGTNALPGQRNEAIISSHWFADPPAEAKSLITASGKRHYPIIFLIDQKNDRGICLKKQGDSISEASVQPREALFRNLLIQIVLNNKLMVVSKGLAYGLIALAHERGDYAVAKRAIKERWAIYNVPETQFTIWLPHDYTDFYADILKLSSLEKLSTSTRSEILRYCPSAYVLDDDPRIKELQRKYHEQDLVKIFDLDRLTHDKNAICDVSLVGHGVSGVSVAGLPVSKSKPETECITSLLSFLNDNLNAGAVCINSCQAGGQNVTLMRTKRDGKLIDNKYAFIICSVTDRLIVMRASKVISWTNSFFDFALELCQQGHGALERFTKTIVPDLRIPNAEVDPRGYTAFPQMWLPGNLEYQARNATKDVRVVGRIPARASAEQGRSIDLQDQQVVLWYPKVVNAAVDIAPARINVDTLKISPHQFGAELGTAEECMNMALTQSELDRIYTTCPALSSLVHTNGKDVVQQWINQAKKYLYPEFILMGGTAHRRLWLKKVVIEGGGNPLMGIVRFLRDSFASADWDSLEQKDILIESLEGANDVPLHMEAAAERGERPSSASLYEKLRATAGQKITLENVMVRINASEHLGKIAFYIPFDGQWWLYTVPLKRPDDSSAQAWDFKPTTAPAIEAFKKALKVHDVPAGRIVAKLSGINSTTS